MLASVDGIQNLSRTVVLAFGTDGVDGAQARRGPPVAGAVADDSTWNRARGMGLDPARFLAESDSYSFFKKVGGQIITGPTNTNVNDLYMMLLF